MLKWAVSHSVLQHFFFSLFIILFFFHSFQLLENTKKIYTYFFFHCPEYSNKFIKNYFIQFSSVLHCKTLENKFFLSPHFFFHFFPLNQINLFNFIFFLLFVPVFTHCKNSQKFSYVLSTKHTNHTQYMITHHSCYAYFSYNNSSNHTKHTKHMHAVS